MYAAWNVGFTRVEPQMNQNYIMLYIIIQPGTNSIYKHTFVCVVAKARATVQMCFEAAEELSPPAQQRPLLVAFQSDMLSSFLQSGAGFAGADGGECYLLVKAVCCCWNCVIYDDTDSQGIVMC